MYLQSSSAPKSPKTPQKRKYSFDNVDKTPVKKIKAGEDKVDLTLMVVAFERKLLTLETIQNEQADIIYHTLAIGTDGHKNYIQINAWGQENSHKMDQIINDNSIGNCFIFKNFKVTQIREDTYNLGSVDYQMNFESYSIILPEEISSILLDNPVQDFYDYLAEKHKMKPAEIGDNTIKIQAVNGAETIIRQLELKIRNIGDVQMSNDGNGYMTSECTILLDGPDDTAMLKGLHTYAYFLNNLLLGKEECTLIIQVNCVHFENGFLHLKWNSDVKYAIKANLKQGIPFSLSEMPSHCGSTQVSIRLLLIGDIIQYNTTYQLAIATDGMFKTQLKFPIQMEVISNEFLLNVALINWTETGVLTLTINSEEDIDWMLGEDKVLSINNSYQELDLEYPPIEGCMN